MGHESKILPLGEGVPALKESRDGRGPPGRKQRSGNYSRDRTLPSFASYRAKATFPRREGAEILPPIIILSQVGTLSVSNRIFGEILKK